MLIVYEFRRKLHQVQFTEKKKVLLPHRGKAIDGLVFLVDDFHI